ncbi:hypothetical protein [Rhodococcus sp. (in: high G+C Gram-positive bacteria)]|uniref:hypothetical protein n=1 Tax=Rhodococcus sp. TaxID=1831 RepID=UPI00388FD6A4
MSVAALAGCGSDTSTSGQHVHEGSDDHEMIEPAVPAADRRRPDLDYGNADDPVVAARGRREQDRRPEPGGAVARRVEVPFSGSAHLVCIGQNFHDHAAEVQVTMRSEDPLLLPQPVYTLSTSGMTPRPEGCRTMS